MPQLHPGFPDRTGFSDSWRMCFPGPLLEEELSSLPEGLASICYVSLLLLKGGWRCHHEQMKQKGDHTGDRLRSWGHRLPRLSCCLREHGAHLHPTGRLWRQVASRLSFPYLRLLQQEVGLPAGRVRCIMGR